MKRIAIFASGTGTNALKIIEHFKEREQFQVGLIVSNKRTAKVLEIAREHQIATLVIDRPTFYESDQLLAELNRLKIDFIVLAGFLWLIPDYLVEAYQGRMVNIHPALLPDYGGKGMYGMRVHEAVKAAGERESGITIHYVNPHYDEGAIIFQARCAIEPADTPENIAKKVQKLEHQYFPSTIEKLLRKLTP